MNCSGEGAVIELAELTKRFGRKVAVDGVTLSVPSGTTLGLVGPNGAGKSTLIKMIVGLTPCSSGSLRVFGRLVGSEASGLGTRLGYVPENHHPYGWMTVSEIVAFVKSFHARWDDEHCTGMLRLFALDPSQRVRSLSKGMTVKLALVLATSFHPELLILDEPTSGLDPVAREEVIEGIVELKRRQEQTILFSSHILRDIQRHADTVAIILDGRVRTVRPVAALLASVKRLRLTLREGTSPLRMPTGLLWNSVQGHDWAMTVDGYTPDLVEWLKEQNPVEDVKVLDADLEDLFLAYVKGKVV